MVLQYFTLTNIVSYSLDTQSALTKWLSEQNSLEVLGNRFDRFDAETHMRVYTYENHVLACLHCLIFDRENISLPVLLDMPNYIN